METPINNSNDSVPTKDNVSFLHGNSPVTISGYKGEYLFEQIRKNSKFYEDDVLSLLGHLSSFFGNKTIVDVGANIGNHTIFFSKILDQKVFTFEPIESNISLLRDNISANDVDDKVVLRPLALWSSVEHINFTQNIEHNGGTFSGVADDSGSWITSTLDLEIDEPVSILKIDVEGAENQVLKGSVGRIESDLPVISVEIHDVRNYIEIFDTLRAFSYEVIAIVGRSDNYIFFSRKHPAFHQARRLVEVMSTRRIVRNTNR